MTLSRTVPTAAAVVMIATGIALAQSAEPAPTADGMAPPAQEADTPSDVNPTSELTREQRRERRERFMEQRGGEGVDGRRGGREGHRAGPPQRGGEQAGRGAGPQGPREPGQGLRMLFRDVNLTDVQQEEVRQIVQDATTPMQEYMAQNAAAFREARDAMAQARENQDREAMEAARESMRALRDAGPKVDREALTASVREVLNDSQREVFDANLADFQERRTQRDERRQQMKDGDRPQRGERSRRGDGPANPEAPAPTDGDQLDI